jgi:hypothetical protein
MQQVEEAPRLEPERKRAHLSPTRAFALLAVVLAAAGAVLYFARPEADQAPTGIPESDNFALTDTEAISRFEALDKMRLAAYARRDPSLISAITTRSSPLRTVGSEEIQQLLADDVRARPEVETRLLMVRENSAERIVIRHKFLERSIFLSEAGKDITTSKPVVKTVDWTLELEGSSWLIQNATLIESDDVREG